MAGRVLYREGDDRPLTIASAEAIADGPGWRLRFGEIATREAADGLRGAYLESIVRADEDLARGEYYWHEVVGCAVRGVDGAELGHGPGHLPGRRDRGLRRRWRAVRRASTCRPSARSSGSSRRGVARSSSTPSRSTCARRARARPIRSGRRRRAGARGARTVRRRRRRRPQPIPRRPRPAAPEHARAGPPTRRRPSHDPRDRRPDALPGDGRRRRSPRASRAGSRSRAWPRSGSTTCASGASGGTARSTTRRTAGERG